MATITGTEDNNNLWGTPEADTIYGLGGLDLIDARDGDDTIYGGNEPGRFDYDEIFGGNGNDEIYGEDGGDFLIGGQQEYMLTAIYPDSATNNNDVIYGGAGDDFFLGGPGESYLVGGSGRDTFLINETRPEYHHIDTVVDFDPGEGDKIQVERALWSRRSEPEVVDGDTYIWFHRPGEPPFGVVVLNYTDEDLTGIGTL